MTYDEATAALAGGSYSGDVEQITQVIEAYDRQQGSSDLWESSRLLLQACDVLSSHEFRDKPAQSELIRAYAQRALLRSNHASIEQELRLLSHLLHDYEDSKSSQPWPAKRLARARRWLRALKVLAQDTRDFSIQNLPASKTPAPEQDLPGGVAIQHVKDSKLRNEYRQAVNSNRHDAERFAFQWRMMQLRRVYEPLATKYITGAYGREPYNLWELKQLLDDYPSQEEIFGKELTGETAKGERDGAPEPISARQAPQRVDRLQSKTRRARRGAAGRKSSTRVSKGRKS